MATYILFIHVLIAISVICFVLLQRGKGADAGASFGGASQSIFGASGSGNFLTKTTSILMTLFFLTSLALVYLAKSDYDDRNIISAPAEQVMDSMISEDAKPTIEDLE
ncbi:preprotein translocase subunit SecG [Marinicellulosiphila megalodicopiae]|uniref:preprotein translocase subunit SecG n=1 Tax=Marinicellulosiphila megalodicopiae TaxID=2724896 RepID=UPI003BB0CB8B